MTQSGCFSSHLSFEIGSIRRESLEESTGLSVEDFNVALKQVLRFGLLEPATDDRRYLIHSKTRSFALEKSAERRKFWNEARERFVKHYLHFVRAAVSRSTRRD